MALQICENVKVNENVAIATDNPTEPHMIVKVLEKPAAISMEAKMLVQKYEPTQPGGSVLKLIEKKFPVSCSSVRLRDIQLGQHQSSLSNRQSTRLSRSMQRPSAAATYWLPSEVKSSILIRSASD
jgi:hypothetical protein